MGMPRILVENLNLYAPDIIEEKYTQRDAAQSEVTEHERKTRNRFGRRDTSRITGHPLHMIPWINGIHSHLGFRRQ